VTGTWSPDELVRRHARDAGEAPAILDGETVVTWAQLDARADDVGRRLAEAGTATGAVVAVRGDASATTIVDMLGVLRAGGIAAPLPTGQTSVERATAMALLDPAAVLGADRLDARPGRVLEGPGLVVLTSGTTGRPKGVVLPLAALAASADAWMATLPPATGWLLALGLAHVAGLGVLWRAIAARVPVRQDPPGDPAALLAGLRAEPASSHVSLVPAQLARVLDALSDGRPPDTLRAVPLGGGIIPAPLVVRALDAGWPVVPTYGLSEAGSGVTALASGEAREAAGTAGRPLPGVSVTIDEPDRDGVGEIVVSTLAGFAGYLGEDGAPRRPGDPIRTGDLGRVDAEGRLTVIDRRTDRIVRGGENIAPAEVEAVLAAHPAVEDAAVVARPDPTWGQVPVAAVVLRAGVPDPGDDALAAHCRTSLAGFKVPAAFLRLDALPRTAGGKLRREAVRAVVAGERTGELARQDGAAIGWRVTGEGPLPVVLLHGTLSNAMQLDRLAAAIAHAGDVTVHALDRRGAGSGRRAPGVGSGPQDIGVHVADLIAYLDARLIDRAVLVGVSFGAVLALETAARHPDRVDAVVAWEPPYGPLADERMQAVFGTLAAATAAAHRTGGGAAAAETFLRAVAGDAAWDRLPERSRAFLAAEGDAAVSDAALSGAHPEELRRIAAPVTVLTGGASEPFYRPIADAVASRIPGSTRVTLHDLAHPAPITEPARVAAAVRAALADAGLVPRPEPAA
jgi:o-succinylbenzoate---CoA ligase